MDRRAMSEIQIRDVHGRALVDGCALLARSLEFSDRDALPPWLVQTAAGFGGLALGAFEHERLIGFSFALPAGPKALFSCGLAVLPRARGRGVGLRLKLRQRERALAAGATIIRWTADPLCAPALALYLGALHARLVAYEPELYADVRPAPVAPDDVVIEWPLRGNGPTLGMPGARVEIPLDRGALGAQEHASWRMDVRAAMTEVLAAGGVGTDVAIDRAGGRAWVLFREAA
jgi:predicted GNAT superfamily acetyltransferase